MGGSASYLKARKSAKRLQVPNHPSRPRVVYSIPLPIENRGGTRKFDHFYPFEEMRVGGSFWVPSSSHCTSGAVTRFSKRTGWKFVTRAQSKDGRPNTQVSMDQRGIRVWRVQ